MAKPRRKSKAGLDTTTLLAGVAGVIPIPIVGEVGLSYFFYKILESTPYKSVAIPAALLTRFALYTQFYAPIYEKIFS
ncbi:MAG: hypothetical protein AABY16_04775 [Nanoarchaeota archaeon]